MPFNVLLLPLLGGYVFVAGLYRTRYEASRLSGHKLIFWSAIAGVGLLGLSTVGVWIIARLCPAAPDMFYAVFPFPYFGVALGAFLIGIVGWGPINVISNKFNLSWSKENQQLRSVSDSGDHLEYLLMQAMRFENMIQVSTSSGKVYVGQVTKTIDPVHDGRYIRLLPALSGYRSAHDRSIKFTTEYSKVLDMVEGGQLEHLNPEDFEIVIPVSTVQTISKWDGEAWDQFLPQQEGVPPEGISSEA